MTNRSAVGIAVRFILSLSKDHSLVLSEQQERYFFMQVQSNTERSKELLKKAYAYFNARNIDAILALMKLDVVWANGMDGGYVYGHDGVREYWTRQWKMIDPHVEPIDFETNENRNVVVNVHQVVHDLNGNLLKDAMVQHIYFIKNGSVHRMEIHEP